MTETGCERFSRDVPMTRAGRGRDSKKKRAEARF
jgi:hypothetical protein